MTVELDGRRFQYENGLPDSLNVRHLRAMVKSYREIVNSSTNMLNMYESELKYFEEKVRGERTVEQYG